jgi:hypothetical protein
VALKISEGLKSESNFDAWVLEGVNKKIKEELIFLKKLLE